MGEHMAERGVEQRVPELTAREEFAQTWPILLGTFLGVAGGISALPYYTQGLFVQALSHDFGWTREQLSLVTLGGGVVLALTSPLIGLMIDRFGVRVPLLCSFAAMAAGYLALSATGASFNTFFALQIAIFIGGAVTSPVAFTRIINQKFKAMRGLAIGLTLAGSGAVAVLAPPALAAVIRMVGWRSAYQVIALTITLAATASLLLLWASGGPERRRLAGSIEPQGAMAPTPRSAPPARFDMVLFLRLLVTFVLISLAIGGFAFHLVSILTDAGVTLTRAASVQSMIGLSILIGRPGAGFLVDRFFAPRVSALVLLSAAAGLGGLAVVGAPLAPVCALLVGFALGAEIDLIGYLVARYFALARYGRLVGLLYGLSSLGLGFSPVLMARMREAYGSYTAPLSVACILMLLATVSMLTLPRFGESR